jgi:hypothetical protein
MDKRSILTVCAARRRFVWSMSATARRRSSIHASQRVIDGSLDVIGEAVLQSGLRAASAAK